MNAPINQSLLRKSGPIYDSLRARRQDKRWETFIERILKRLELPKDHYNRAEREYKRIGEHIATHFDLPAERVDVFPQGSMRTSTTIKPRGNTKFDLDIVARLTGVEFESMTPDEFFSKFEGALKGLPEICGKPEPKNRCWRLPFERLPFYFDVTPALPAGFLVPGAPLRVRDKQRGWTASNPHELALWFEAIADQRFLFQNNRLVAVMDAAVSVAPLPDSDIDIDDILRRAIQLMKLHRDNFYFYADAERKEAAPISIIIMTLATHAYQHLARTKGLTAGDSLEIVLELIELMPKFIQYDARGPRIPNPKLEQENFADRWSSDGGARAREFNIWHSRLMEDLESMFSEDAGKSSEGRIRSVFGEDGVAAWKSMQPSNGTMFPSLLAAAPAILTPISTPSRAARTTLS
ncbi:MULTISPECIES: nucleotidyltransferase [unclassified Paraburkholderia]|uniref:nucleotidyltransferase domain-containing protein n=1 Tax=unclassified Paraburkholderia TaxID=2615204 RepID=UPI002AB11C11|nr:MULTISPECIES: nucleotidyltransferase [unclassified Paraburkholderia]